MKTAGGAAEIRLIREVARRIRVCLFSAFRFALALFPRLEDPDRRPCRVRGGSRFRLDGAWEDEL
jgi:hypothetical protein